MPNFTYTRNIPDGPHNPSNDQPNMQTNTNSTDDLIAFDHFSFEDNFGGLHKQVTLKDESAPGLRTGNGVLFSNLAFGQSLPFWQNAIKTYAIALSDPAQSNVTGPNGYLSVGFGLILQWGTVSFAPGNDHLTARMDYIPSGNINFPNASFVVTLGLKAANGTVTTSSDTLGVFSSNTTGFNWVFNSSSSTGSTSYPGFFWIALGN